MLEASRDLTRTVLAILFMAVLAGFSFFILRPFLGAGVWATMIAIATWPLLASVQRRLAGKRSLAVALLTGGLLLLFFVPLAILVGTVLSHTDEIATWAKNLAAQPIAPPPDWLGRIPLVGGKAVAAWEKIATTGIQPLLAQVAPHAADMARWLAGGLGSLAVLLGQFLLTVIITAVLWSSGETAARGLLAFAHRLAGPRGENALRLAAQAIRGVAFGVVGTALVQSTLAGLGMAVAGVPAAGVLSAVALVLCIAQLGPILVLLPAVAWLYVQGSMGWAIVGSPGTELEFAL